MAKIISFVPVDGKILHSACYEALHCRETPRVQSWTAARAVAPVQASRAQALGMSPGFSTLILQVSPVYRSFIIGHFLGGRLDNMNAFGKSSLPSHCKTHSHVIQRAIP